MIEVVTVVGPGKEYCLKQLLDTWKKLQAPKGHSLRFIVEVAGDLAFSEAWALKGWESRPKRRVNWGPPPVDFSGQDHPRNRCAAELRERLRPTLTGDWVFWFDCDVLVEPDALLRLLAHGAPVSSGVVMDRTFIPSAMAFTVAEGTIQVSPGPQDVDWVGFGCLLTRGDLVQQISFAPYLNGEGEQRFGEDGYWCLEAAKLTGRPLLLDADVRPLHVHESGLAGQITWDDFGRMGLRQVRAFGTPAAGALYSKIDGISPRFGEMRVGQPVTHFNGEPLTEADMERLGRESEFLVYAPSL